MTYLKGYLLTLFGCWFTLITTSSSPPHIVFILVDDVGYYDFSYNNGSIPTPFIDKLSSEGIRFSQHYGHPTCTPTRASLLTGLYAANTGLAFAALPGSTAGLPDNIPTLPQILRKVGYNTHIVGKWHLGHSQWKQTPVGKGFESHMGCFMYDIDSYSKEMHSRQWKPKHIDWIHTYENRSFTHFIDPRHATIAITDLSQQIIKSQDTTKPLFLYVAYTAAHSPLQSLPEHLSACSHLTHSWRREYCGMVVGLDEGIKNITQTIRESLGENTIVIVSSDNGASQWFGGLNIPYRAGKLTPFEGGIRLPAFAVDFTKDGRYLGPKGRHYDGMMHISDWFPTLTTIAGGINEIKDLQLDGKDLGPSIRNGLASPRNSIVIDDFLAGENIWPDEHLRAYRKGKYKLIQGYVRDSNWYSESTSNFLNASHATYFSRFIEHLIHFYESFIPSGHFDPFRVVLVHAIVQSSWSQNVTLLYNIEEDPIESNNLYFKYPEIVKELENDMKIFHKKRPKQQKYWFNIDHESYQRSLVEGDCSAMKEIQTCLFAHPWLDDTIDLDTIPIFPPDADLLTFLGPKPGLLMISTSIIGFILIVLMGKCCNKIAAM